MNKTAKALSTMLLTLLLSWSSISVAGIPRADVWLALGAELSLGDEVAHTRIDEELHWLRSHPEYLARVTRRAQPYIHYVYSRVREAGLPAEIALLPIVESAYDPFAYSPGRAAGLWQFIPATGRQFGLRQDWWYDGRRDVVASTDAAIAYLSQLHGRFDDWMLALAAYNAGQARVARAIKKNSRKDLGTDYWSLALPKETVRYVPRLLAIAKVLAEPERYGVELTPVVNMPYFEAIDIGSQLDLAQAAKLAGVKVDTLYQLNPGVSRWASPPTGPHRLLVPQTVARVFRSQLRQLDAADRVGWRRYKVKSGDTLSEIARAHGSSALQIAEINALDGSRVRANQHLMIPVASEENGFYVLSSEQRRERLFANTLKKSNVVYHRVAAGESWWSIAHRYQVSHKSLARWNGKAAGDTLRPGDKLLVRQGKRSDADSPREEVTRKIAYRVRKGDNLSKIAQRFQVDVNQLVAWNDINQSSYLQPGDNLKIHVAVAGAL